MDLYEIVVLPFGAVGLVAGLAQGVAGITGQLRGKKYRTYEDWAAKQNDAAETPQTLSRSRASLLQNALWKLASPIHDSAVLVQSAYVAQVAKAATCAGLAILALALSMTPLATNHRIESTLCWIEFIAIGLILWHFTNSRAANSSWLKLRAKTELLRQFSFMATVFPGAALWSPDKDITSNFEAFEGQTNEATLNVPIEKLIALVTDFWNRQRRLLLSSNLTENDLTEDAVQLYERKRANRQLNWFADSGLRLHQSAEERERWMRILFFLALSLATTKLALVLCHSFYESSQLFQGLPSFHSLLDVLGVALIVISAAAAAATAYYFNQNARSLIHRYGMQERYIRRWLERWTAACNPKNGPFEDIQKETLRNLVLEFEGLMAEELNDWLRVSSHDTLELSA